MQKFWVVLILFTGLAFAWYYIPYNVLVQCSKIDEDRKIEVVQYSIRPFPEFGPHIGGEAVNHGIRFRTSFATEWVLEETWFTWRERSRVCERSLIVGDRMVIFPVKIVRTNQEELPAKIEVLSTDMYGMIVFDGRRWFYQSVAAGSETRASQYALGSEPLTPWTTNSVGIEGQRLIAWQSATLQKVAEAGIPNHPPWTEEYYAFGEKLDTGSFPELRPLVERRLASEDFGRTWKVLDWKVLRPEAVPKGAELKLIPQPMVQ